MATPLKVQPYITKVDRIRERELLRYYQPRDNQNLSAHPQGQADPQKAVPTKATSPDIALTALAQLVAIRLNVRSVLIKYGIHKSFLSDMINPPPSVITKDTQYTISEGTKTLNLSDTRQSEAEGDDLWIGCDSLDKNKSLCQVSLNVDA